MTKNNKILHWPTIFGLWAVGTLALTLPQVIRKANSTNLESTVLEQPEQVKQRSITQNEYSWVQPLEENYDSTKPEITYDLRDKPETNIPLIRIQKPVKQVEPKKPYQSGRSPLNGWDDGYALKKEVSTPALKYALRNKESNNRLSAVNQYSGARGLYQFLPETAIALIRKAKEEGKKIPYSGPLTSFAVKKALTTNKVLNEALINYDLEKKSEIFDGNPGLIAMAHYAGPNDLIKSLERVYPGETDYSQVNIEQFAKLRAKGLSITEHKGRKIVQKTGKGNDWLLQKQDHNHPSILEYAKDVVKRAENYAKRI